VVFIRNSIGKDEDSKTLMAVLTSELKRFDFGNHTNIDPIHNFSQELFTQPRIQSKARIKERKPVEQLDPIKNRRV
jgi:hypothetical protein